MTGEVMRRIHRLHIALSGALLALGMCVAAPAAAQADTDGCEVFHEIWGSTGNQGGGAVRCWNSAYIWYQGLITCSSAGAGQYTVPGPVVRENSGQWSGQLCNWGDAAIDVDANQWR
jgi:hypothetical protein